MPSIIDPETLYVDDLPAIWSPVQWELSEEEHIQAVEEQATASLLWTMYAPEAILRLLLGETDIQRLTEKDGAKLFPFPGSQLFGVEEGLPHSLLGQHNGRGDNRTGERPPAYLVDSAEEGATLPQFPVEVVPHPAALGEWPRARCGRGPLAARTGLRRTPRHGRRGHPRHG